MNEAVRIIQRHVRISDPHVTSDDADRLSILANVFESLVRPVGDGSFAPLLARSWTLADDARKWEFTLRDDVTYHDGRALVADDVVRSLTRIRDESIGGELGTGGVIKNYLRDSRIHAVDTHGVVVETALPMADLLDLLVDLPILSERSIDSLADGEYVGTGPYRIYEIAGDSVVMRANTSYHDHKRFRPDTLQWTGVSDPDARREFADSNDADVVTGLRAADVRSIERNRSATVLRSSTTVCATFMFNLLSGASTSRALRRAINFAVDAEALIRDVAGGEATAITGPMTSRHLGYDPTVSGFEYNPGAARRELDGMKGDFPDLITLDVPTVLPDEARELAARIGGYLEVVGLNVEVAVHTDRPGYAEMVKSKQIHDAACFDSSPASTYRLLREKFHSGFAGPWWLGYTNPEVDLQIDRAASTVDTNSRRSLYQSVFRQLSEDAPWIYLYSPTRLASIEKSLAETADRSGWTPAPGGILKFV